MFCASGVQFHHQSPYIYVQNFQRHFYAVVRCLGSNGGFCYCTVCVPLKTLWMGHRSAGKSSERFYEKLATSAMNVGTEGFRESGASRPQIGSVYSCIIRLRWFRLSINRSRDVSPKVPPLSFFCSISRVGVIFFRVRLLLSLINHVLRDVRSPRRVFRGTMDVSALIPSLSDSSSCPATLSGVVSPLRLRDLSPPASPPKASLPGSLGVAGKGGSSRE